MSEERKLDFSAISFDDMLGDGIEAPAAEEVQEQTPVSEELDDDLQEAEASVERDHEDSDFEDGVDDPEQYEEKEDRTVEDSGDEEIEFNSVADEIAGTIGLELENQYADTVEGLTEFVRDAAQEVAEDQIQDLFGQFPLIQQHLDYVLAGGDSEKFFEAYNPSLDYGNFQINEKDVGIQKAVLSQYFQAKGHGNEFISELLEDYEDSGKLHGKAEAARDALAQAQEYERQGLLEQQQEQFQAQAEEQEEFWNGVADIIEDGNEFAGIRIPDNDKSEFFDYISEPVDDSGRTQRDIDYSEASMEVKLAIDYLMYGGFQLDDIIDVKARTKSVQNLRQRIVQNEDTVKNARKAQRKAQKTFDPDQLDINALF